MVITEEMRKAAKAETEFAIRAVACKNWRWMPGMSDGNCRVLYVRDDGNLVIDGITHRETWDALSGTEEDEVPRLTVIRPEIMNLPDFKDPATRGCLLELMREALGDPYASVSRLLTPPFDWAATWRKDGVLHAPQSCTSEVEALVAALEFSGNRNHQRNGNE